jgi:hypothetical protein
MHEPAAPWVQRAVHPVSDSNRLTRHPLRALAGPVYLSLVTGHFLAAECRAKGPIAQRLEQGTHNPLVLGSNPGGPTTKNGVASEVVTPNCNRSRTAFRGRGLNKMALSAPFYRLNLRYGRLGRSCIPRSRSDSLIPMSATPQQQELVAIPPQQSVDERLSKALRAIDAQFHGDFEAFAQSVLPPVPKVRPSPDGQELVALVGRAYG